MSHHVRSPLKWAGGKFQLLDRIIAALPQGRRLVEPFVGSGTVFLNTDYPAYLLCDLNEDLINFFQRLTGEGDSFVQACAAHFTPEWNTVEAYYALRDHFNSLGHNSERAAIFLYLNRHSFNGLIRYNSKGLFNAPFGKYASPYFPEKELRHCIAKTKQADIRFALMDFRQTFASLHDGDVVYCDPPYIALSETANFTAYTADSFGKAEQLALSRCALKAQKQGYPVILSNHDTDFSRQMYHAIPYTSFPVQRFISCKGDGRAKAQELLVTYYA